MLHHQAFDNSLQANILFTTSNGKIILANRAACKLLGYSKKELLAKTMSSIFDINDANFKIMLRQTTAKGRSTAFITAIKKSGKQITCQISSAVFMGEDGTGKTINTIADMTQSILKQKKIDVKKEKIVAYNIALAKSHQKEIDILNKKIVADNIKLAKSKQKEIDILNKKIVADNIKLAKSKQKEIDIINKKIVSDNILLAKSKQKGIDVKNGKTVAENIAIAISKQKGIDIKNKKNSF